MDDSGKASDLLAGMVAVIVVLFILFNGLAGCRSPFVQEEEPAPTPHPGEMVTDPNGVPDGALEIEFWTNDTKAEWVGEVTARFNQARHKTADGRPIFVHVFRSDSGEFLP